LEPVFVKGRLVGETPSLSLYPKLLPLPRFNRLWEEVKRFEHPHRYYVDLSQKLWEMKQEMLCVGNV
jgi:nicotinate phosphoribosyltransferase